MSALDLTEKRASLRDRQKAATEELILEAAKRCFKDDSLADFSFGKVAGEAGIAERTIYRYFPTKEALLEAFWRAHQATIKQGPYPDTAAKLITAGPRVFPEFDKQAEWFRGSLLSPQGRAIAMHFNNERTAAVRKAVRDGVGDLPEPEFTQLCAVIQTLYSAAAWLQMREFWELTGEESGKAVSEAIEVLLSNARKRARKSKAETKS